MNYLLAFFLFFNFELVFGAVSRKLCENGFGGSKHRPKLAYDRSVFFHALENLFHKFLLEDRILSADKLQKVLDDTLSLSDALTSLPSISMATRLAVSDLLQKIEASIGLDPAEWSKPERESFKNTLSLWLKELTELDSSHYHHSQLTVTLPRIHGLGTEAVPSLYEWETSPAFSIAGHTVRVKSAVPYQGYPKYLLYNTGDGVREIAFNSGELEKLLVLQENFLTMDVQIFTVRGKLYLVTLQKHKVSRTDCNLIVFTADQSEPIGIFNLHCFNSTPKFSQFSVTPVGGTFEYVKNFPEFNQPMEMSIVIFNVVDLSCTTFPQPVDQSIGPITPSYREFFVVPMIENRYGKRIALTVLKVSSASESTPVEIESVGDARPINNIFVSKFTNHYYAFASRYNNVSKKTDVFAFQVPYSFDGSNSSIKNEPKPPEKLKFSFNLDLKSRILDIYLKGAHYFEHRGLVYLVCIFDRAIVIFDAFNQNLVTHLELDMPLPTKTEVLPLIYTEDDVLLQVKADEYKTKLHTFSLIGIVENDSSKNSE